MVPKYIPFERSDTWSAAISGVRSRGQSGRGDRKACHNGREEDAKAHGTDTFPAPARPPAFS